MTNTTTPAATLPNDRALALLGRGCPNVAALAASLQGLAGDVTVTAAAGGRGLMFSVSSKGKAAMATVTAAKAIVGAELARRFPGEKLSHASHNGYRVWHLTGETGRYVTGVCAGIVWGLPRPAPRASESSGAPGAAEWLRRRMRG